MTEQRIIDATASAVLTSTKTTLGASGASLVAYFANLDLVAQIGLCIGVAGFFVSLCGLFVNWYYKAKENRCAEELHQATLKNLQEELHVKQK